MTPDQSEQGFFAKLSETARATRSRTIELSTWVFLSRLRNSFVSKALSALSISALVISNIPHLFENLGVTPWTIVSVYLGSIIFLLGYLMFYLYAPREFQGHGEMVDHVSRMQILSSTKFVNSRLDLAGKFLEKLDAEASAHFPKGLLESLQATVDYFAAKNEEERLAEAQRLFQDDLAAREHDNPNLRLRVAGCLCSGAFLLALPTALNVIVSLWRVIF